MDSYVQKLGIKTWPDADRPREKLILQGRRALTDAELIAILISSGNKSETAVDLSKRILSHCENDLAKLAKLGIKELSKFNGIGKAKALGIVAALELGRRRKEKESDKMLPKIISSVDAYLIFRSELADLAHEEFWILLLNKANRVIAKQHISTGGQAMTIVDPKVIFKIAFEHNAISIILGHNHPSGNKNPSKSDLHITKKLVEAGKLLELQILDHIIVYEDSFLSMADEKLGGF
jgi:DNA repair protein RadC